ncbi:heterokaryon incompatibility protein-domain-containing protein [Clohesyomyces aquaticus]|uniref:Heterokaryon incompatibility protein-domain-containing protein n=1 Tax=Clohesyomyces aquaticus TaxID=1231657 RepID=A0A1Y1ZU29_9PLEO|nr:heterokaryon incompatibility protein-domain-containing protein [Clohesyomyces aquaticus]
MLNDPWYHKSPRSIEATEVWGLCSTCSWINFDWLLSHDLRGTILKHNMQYAPMRTRDVKLPFGGLAKLCARASSCRFCKLVVESFETAYPEFIALKEFQTTGEKDPMLHSQLRQRVKAGNSEFIFGIESTENGEFEIRTRNWTPMIQGHNKEVGRYSLQVWLFSAKGGQKIARVQIHRVWEKAIPYQGRRMGQQIDFGLVRAWIGALPPFEREGTSGLSPVIQKDFMLLDAVDKCVVRISQPAKCAALSYVWGATNTLLHKKETSTKSRRPQGVPLWGDAVPKTIRDSMQLVVTIGYRYLWVDSLCVTQDDEEYKMLQINNMDSIYRSGSFTTVNTNGDHADAGLLGVRVHTRSWYQHIQRVGKTNLANRPEMPVYADSPWGGRAWTLQEGAMSRRKLALCQTFKSDFLFGLPISELEHALLWFPEMEPKRRIQSDTNQPICPSWSWMGWEDGTIQYGSVKAEHLGHVTWIDPVNGASFTSQDIRGVTLKPTFVSKTPLQVAKGWSFQYVGKSVAIPGQYSLVRPLYVDRESAITVSEHPVADDEKRKTRYHLEATFTHQEPLLLTCEALTAKFKLRNRRTRLEDFGPGIKNTYKDVRLFGLEDGYGNVAGAVGLHDYPHADSKEGGDAADVSCVVITRINRPHYAEISDLYRPENDSDAQEAAESFPDQQDEKEEEPFPVYSKFSENVASGFPSMSGSRPLKWTDALFGVMTSSSHGVCTRFLYCNMKVERLFGLVVVDIVWKPSGDRGLRAKL